MRQLVMRTDSFIISLLLTALLLQRRKLNMTHMMCTSLPHLNNFILMFLGILKY